MKMNMKMNMKTKMKMKTLMMMRTKRTLNVRPAAADFNGTAGDVRCTMVSPDADESEVCARAEEAGAAVRSRRCTLMAPLMGTRIKSSARPKVTRPLRQHHAAVRNWYQKTHGMQAIQGEKETKTHIRAASERKASPQKRPTV